MGSNASSGSKVVCHSKEEQDLSCCYVSSITAEVKPFKRQSLFATLIVLIPFLSLLFIHVETTAACMEVTEPSVVAFDDSATGYVIVTVADKGTFEFTGNEGDEFERFTDVGVNSMV